MVPLKLLLFFSLFYLSSVNADEERPFDNTIEVQRNISGVLGDWVNKYRHPEPNNAVLNNTTREKDADNEKIYGVSLGGWLVLEPWITPSLFDEAANYSATGEIPGDEYSFCKLLGKDECKRVLQQHWDSFYNKDDFEDIAKLGINLVRIPIGYWAFGLLDDDPYVQGQEEYLDKAIGWAQSFDLDVQIDLHGMPGSQNGFDNSGLRTNEPKWLEVEAYMNLTYKVLDYFVEKYCTNEFKETVKGIQVVNEPFSYKIDMEKLIDFYFDAYDMIREKGIDTELFFHDGFLPIGSWDWFMNNSATYPNITLDHHLYEIFSTNQVALGIEEHVNNVIGQGEAMAKIPQKSIVGEFSGAITDCTKYINGVGLGARYNGTFPASEYVGSCEGHDDIHSWSPEKKKDTMRFLEVQFDTFSRKSKGWIFWCYKTENTIEWDLKRLNEYDMLPADFAGPPYSPSRRNSPRQTSSEYGYSAQHTRSSGASRISDTSFFSWTTRTFSNCISIALLLASSLFIIA
ncbi:Piso0_001166 [Millerozyma farinosa CBS 7064]|uniref:glucan 1,3-beta-glucosidase n=1 Tax=Pichia sorbitophila (strain ATCC MYA-4447 / BCRC 22081 / CBS 7064 / NBRC 10061 / NRRL Y-12695) TaxID=559304 RepID=G8YPF5_PICSO|nr:Piso0_001166 [Millerozyma farinosa CBS 7064]CCE79126.1 Piso0_001166 [Millerozyma farinosa CBS 7064]